MSGSIEGVARESVYWAEFGAAQSHEQFLASWLAILCTQVDGVTGALLLVISEQANTFTPGAVWPDPRKDMAYLGPIAQQALTERRGIVTAHLPQSGTTGGAYVAY